MAYDEDARAAKEKWEQGPVAKAIARFPERKKEFVTDSGIPVNRADTPADLQDWSYLDKLGFPGEYPYTRGVQPTMYKIGRASCRERV